jgi:hypothetical protein
LSPGADCNISVTFSPQATGTMTSNLSVYDNGSGSPQSIPLSGTGTNPVPTITSLSPPSATAGALPQTLTINGSDFVASSTVTYNAIPHMATVVNSTQLTISLTAGDQATASDYPVVVTNPAPGGGSSNAVNFTVNTPPQPVISSVSLIMAQNKPSRYRGGGLATMDPRLLISATVLWTQCSATRARLPS